MAQWEATFTRSAKVSKGRQRHVVFEVKVKLDSDRHHYVYRRYNDFYNMHITLMRLFPYEAGEQNSPRTIPFMPGKVILMPGQRKMELASQRIPQFNQYLKELLAMDDRISRNKLIRQLLSRQEDDSLYEPQFKAAYNERLESDSNSSSDSSDDSSDSSDDDDDEETSNNKKVSKKTKKKKDKKKKKKSKKDSKQTNQVSVSTQQAAKDLSSGRAVVLFAADEEDTGSGWQGAKLKARTRNPNQYAAFNLPWSKTSKMKLDNIFFCELLLAISEDLSSRPRSDVFNKYEPCVTGVAIAEYLVGNVEGMDSVDEAFPVAQEIINLGAMRPINVSKYEPTSSSFYFLMFSLENLRISLGTVMEKMQEPDADVSTLEKFKQQILLCLKYYSERFGKDRPVNALQAVRHKFRPFTHTQLIACDICDKVMAGKIGLKCEVCGLNVHDACSKITKNFMGEHCFYPPPLPAPIASGQFAKELAVSTSWSYRYIPSNNDTPPVVTSPPPMSTTTQNDSSLSRSTTDDALLAIRNLQTKAISAANPRPTLSPPPNAPTASRPSLPSSSRPSDAYSLSAPIAPKPVASMPSADWGDWDQESSSSAGKPSSSSASVGPSKPSPGPVRAPSLPSMTSRPSPATSALPPAKAVVAVPGPSLPQRSLPPPSLPKMTSTSARTSSTPSLLPSSSLSKPPTLPSTTRPTTLATPASSTTLTSKPASSSLTPPSLPSLSSRPSSSAPLAVPQSARPTTTATSTPNGTTPPLPGASRPSPPAAVSLAAKPPTLPAVARLSIGPPSLPTTTRASLGATQPPPIRSPTTGMAGPSLPSRGGPVPAAPAVVDSPFAEEW